MSLQLAQLSSLDLVRGFVAVGRRMSITLAAQDLCLTQSAVSRQIHALEAQLGVKLLVRGYRSIAFTPEGERLFRSADGAIQQLQDVMGELRTSGALRPVTVTASIGFIGLWLLPRLSRFQQLHPDVDIRVSASNQISDLRNEGIDLAIRYTSADLAPPGSRRLLGDAVAPVAHPSLGIELRSAAEIPNLTLLDFDDPRYPQLQWGEWLAAKGWGETKPRAFLRFNQYDLVIQAALAGQGVALGRLELIRPLIDEGRLAVIGPPEGDSVSHAYWLIRAEERPRPEVLSVATWIEAEAREGR
ncbi:LysR substrate-binding domain-containing protein [Zestomonas carbonaria]|uniref:HTH-type transcriptional regulator PerR n=1 Tax=Zestomonas carbonaria TaxID=2762745 RepID=A0A7U7EK79_9GAMM|nr:LysR substrate-binding domain-containing protein [Pseudomonas carbonaria]CAD5105952.1 HTH-type transcriptional regulator PerR [Pseudomonas carbonaria]